MTIIFIKHAIWGKIIFVIKCLLKKERSSMILETFSNNGFFSIANTIKKEKRILFSTTSLTTECTRPVKITKINRINK